jgi:hypothetical protein
VRRIRHRDFTNFWVLLLAGDTFQQFRHTVEAVPFSKVEWRDSRTAFSTGPEPAPSSVSPPALQKSVTHPPAPSKNH